MPPPGRARNQTPRGIGQLLDETLQIPSRVIADNGGSTVRAYYDPVPMQNDCANPRVSSAQPSSQQKGPSERPMVPKAQKGFLWQLPLPCLAKLAASRLGGLLAGLMLALRWPFGPWPLGRSPNGHWSRRTLVAIGGGHFGARHSRRWMVRETGSINQGQFNRRPTEESRGLPSVPRRNLGERDCQFPHRRK